MGIESEGAVNPNACSWRNAVFDLSASQDGVCGNGVVCDGQGDGPCNCDPCPACATDTGLGTCRAASDGPCTAAGRYSSPGFGDLCAAAGQCVYTPASASTIVEPGSCKPIGWDYCPNVDLNGRYMTTQCAELARPDVSSQAICCCL